MCLFLFPLGLSSQFNGIRPMPPTQTGGCRAARLEQTWTSQANVRARVAAFAMRRKLCTARLQGSRLQGCRLKGCSRLRTARLQAAGCPLQGCRQQDARPQGCKAKAPYLVAKARLPLRRGENVVLLHFGTPTSLHIPRSIACNRQDLKPKKDQLL